MTEKEMKTYNNKTNILLLVEFIIAGFVILSIVAYHRYQGCVADDLNDSICICYTIGNSMDYCMKREFINGVTNGLIHIKNNF